MILVTALVASSFLCVVWLVRRFLAGTDDGPRPEDDPADRIP